MWWNVIVLKGTGWWVLGVPTNAETGGNGWTATILRLAQNVVQAVWNACDSTLDCVGENENTHTSVTNMFSEGEDGNFDMLVDFLLENNCNTLVDFLLKGYKDWFHSPYEIRWDKKGESMKSILTEDAKKIFPLFLDDLRLRCFSLNEPIPPKIMRILGRMQVEYNEEDMESTERRYLKEEKLRLQINPIVQQGKIDYIALRNSQVMSSQCIEQYDVIGFHLFLLWMNPDFSIVQAMHSGDFRGIEAFFRDSFSKIERIVDLVTKLNKDFTSPLEAPGNLISKLQDHIQICETINKLGLIHAGNYEERRMSFKLGTVIQKNIDTLLNITQSLISQEISDKNKHSEEEGPNIDLLCKILDNIAGKVQRNFARGKMVIIGSTIGEIEATGQVILDELQAGFNRQMRAQFWWNPKGEENARIILLGETTIVKLIMVDLISALPDCASSVLPQEKPELIQDLVYIYNYATKRKNHTLEEVINDFTQNGADATENDFPIETIYNLISFADTIPDQSLTALMGVFLDENRKIKSHSYEEYVIKITAQIIRRLHLSNDSSTSSPLIKKIYDSLENKNISHSILNYSKVYLALAVYYIGSGDAAHIGLAKECFIHYKSLSTHLKDDNKNPKNAQDETYFYVTACRNMLWIAPLSSEMLSQLDPLSRDILKMGGVNLMEQVIENHRTSAISGIENVLSDMITSMTSAWVPNHTNDSFQEKIANMIAKTIFYNICTIEIVPNYYLNTPKKREYETREISLTWGFSIVFTYPLASEDLFNRIFSQHSALIEQRIGNMIAIYNQKMELEWSASHNLETGLPNWNALEKVLGDDTDPEQYHIVCVRMEEQNHNVAAIRKDVIDYIATGIKKIDNRILPYYTATAFVFLLPTRCFDSNAVAGFINNFEKTIKSENSQSLHNAHIGCGLQWENIPHIQLYNQASLALETSATHGWISVYTEALQKDYDTKETNKNILRKALTNESEEWGLVPFYQEIQINGSSKYEALMRVHDKQIGKYYAPQPFLDAIDWSSRDQKDISFRMFDRIIGDVEKYPQFCVSFNMHMFDFDDEAVYSRLTSLDKQLCARMTVEILESVDLNDKVVVQKVRNLKRLWFSIAFDDSGKARANADRFYQYPSPDSVKIDGYYVTWLDHANMLLSAAYEKLDTILENDPDTLNEINKIIARDTLQIRGGQNEIIENIQKYIERVWEPKLFNILKHIELRTRRFLGRYDFLSSQVRLIKKQWSMVIAEFVENDTIRSILETMGVEWFQWYGIRKPLPIEEIFRADQKK